MHLEGTKSLKLGLHSLDWETGVEKYRRRKHEQLHLAAAQRCVLKLEQEGEG